jgi:hypothetical protein
MHVVLAYLYGLAFVPNALIYIERFIPWENITIFLNTLGRSGVVESRFEGTDFPQQMSGTWPTATGGLCHARVGLGTTLLSCRLLWWAGC